MQVRLRRAWIHTAGAAGAGWPAALARACAASVRVLHCQCSDSMLARRPSPPRPPDLVPRQEEVGERVPVPGVPLLLLPLLLRPRLQDARGLREGALAGGAGPCGTVTAVQRGPSCWFGTLRAPPFGTFRAPPLVWNLLGPAGLDHPLCLLRSRHACWPPGGGRNLVQPCCRTPACLPQEMVKGEAGKPVAAN